MTSTHSEKPVSDAPWRLLVGVAIGIALGAFAAVFVGYFVFSAGPAGIQDGLGRSLTAAPFFARWLLGADRQWAGWKWFFIDMLWFWPLVAAAIGLGSFAGDRVPKAADQSSGSGAGMPLKILMVAIVGVTAYATLAAVKWAVALLSG